MIQEILSQMYLRMNLGQRKTTKKHTLQEVLRKYLYCDRDTPIFTFLKIVNAQLPIFPNEILKPVKPMEMPNFNLDYLFIKNDKQT